MQNWVVDRTTQPKIKSFTQFPHTKLILGPVSLEM